MDVVAARLGRPADEAVARAEVTGRRRPRKTGQRSAAAGDQVLQMLAHRLGVAEVVVALDEAVKERLLGSSAHQLKRERLDFG